MKFGRSKATKCYGLLEFLQHSFSFILPKMTKTRNIPPQLRVETANEYHSSCFYLFETLFYLIANSVDKYEIMTFQRFIEGTTKSHEHMTELSVFYSNYLASTEVLNSEKHLIQTISHLFDPHFHLRSAHDVFN